MCPAILTDPLANGEEPTDDADLEEGLEEAPNDQDDDQRGVCSLGDQEVAGGVVTVAPIHFEAAFPREMDR